ncbi:MAG: hypothetical protein IJF11_01345 [Clostridia bacterium]|nr:hypothetical protein [Clostridia bacterium]
MTTETGYSHISSANCILYRGYYYDFETQYYYLNARYYDPYTKRFISADSIISGVGGNTNGYNLYVYCFDNPIMYSDSCGSWPTKEEFQAWWKESKSDVVDNFEKAGEFFKKIIEGIVVFGYNMDQDSRNFDINNKSYEVVKEAHYISSYDGTLVIKLPIGGNAFSYGAIFAGDISEIDLKHEYGHYKQFKEIGLKKYTLYVALPSLYGYWSGVDYDDYYSQPWEYGADLYGEITELRKDKNLEAYPYRVNSRQIYESYWRLVK